MAETAAVIRDTALGTAVRCHGCHDLLGDDHGIYVYLDWVLPEDLHRLGWKVSATVDQEIVDVLGEGRWAETVYFHCATCVAEGRAYADGPQDRGDMLLGNLEVSVAFDANGAAWIIRAETEDDEEDETDGGQVDM